MARIHLIGGGKGGVGKSLFARVMIQYCLDKNFPYILFETDSLNPDVKRFYPEGAKEAVFSEAISKTHEADIIFELARKTPVIVNLPAQVTPFVNNWIEKGRLLEIGSDYGVDICHWFVSDGGYDSISLFKESIKKFGEKMPHIFICNLGRTEDWTFLNNDEEFLEIRNKYKKTLQEIEFPLLYPGDRYYIDSKLLSFGAARKDDEMLVMSKQRMHTFLEEAYSEIEKTGMVQSNSADREEANKKDKKAETPKSTTSEKKTSKEPSVF